MQHHLQPGALAHGVIARGALIRTIAEALDCAIVDVEDHGNWFYAKHVVVAPLGHDELGDQTREDLIEVAPGLFAGKDDMPVCERCDEAMLPGYVIIGDDGAHHCRSCPDGARDDNGDYADNGTLYHAVQGTGR